ncbi:RHS repeat domain-containing protein [Chryseobacterium potabilaquae]|uniref:RHS repeat-associated core domain-containing protein n=1 Tax=Chryseobacterium potabilaquae TaxID=2675057 RepID=A0A6N4X9X5_9FLAO|nr:RHS repeat-associated core domain-containing protein [Chryseobacterium potabilaquae]CAA7195188.1 hypothetical protein CHRY9293_01419 [Chryseobacterium potabilaquae]
MGNLSYQYKYNGKELQETRMVSMDWRHYMPDIGHFGVMDPLTEVIPGWTPYRYAFNNPVYFRDPNGLFEKGPEYVSDWIKNTVIGVWFGGVGAGPGALVGGIIVGVIGRWGGSELGEAGVEKVYE